MIATKKGSAALVLAVLLVALGCPREAEQPVDDFALEAPPAATAQPVEQMQASLESIVQAQATFHQEHGRYAEDLTVLLEDYDFRPAGDAMVTLHFQGTAPQHGYIARAVHPNSAEECEVFHGEVVPQRQQVAGQIVCTGP